MTSTLLAFVPLAVVILIAWITTRVIVRSRRGLPSSAPGHPVGVRGWLLFLVLILMWLWPLVSAGRINSDIMAAESQLPELKANAAWHAFRFATWWTLLAFSCLSFYAGLALARGRSRSAVSKAVLVLWVLGPVAMVVMELLIPLLTLGSVNSAKYLVGRLTASIAWPVLWTLYLLKSRRVRTTYALDMNAP
jgi:hypothetical protein